MALAADAVGQVDYASMETFFTKGGKINDDGSVTLPPADAVEAEGAAEIESAAPAPGDLVEVSIRGRKVKMTAEAAEAYTEFVRDTRERDGRFGGELAQLRERAARAETQIETLRTAPVRTEPEIRPPDPRLAATDVVAWQQQFIAYHDAKQKLLSAELDARLSRESASRRAAADKERGGIEFADRFYRANPHLNDPHLKPIVHSVYVEHAAEIDGLPDYIAHERLASMANDRIVAIRTAGKANPTQRPPRLEGPGGPSPRVPATKPDRVFTSSDWSARTKAAMRGDRRAKAKE